MKIVLSALLQQENVVDVYLGPRRSLRDKLYDRKPI